MVVAALTAAALPVVVVNPRQARDFAKATGQLAKPDALDAHRPPDRGLEFHGRVGREQAGCHFASKSYK